MNKPWKGPRLPVAGFQLRNLRREPRLTIDAENTAKATPIWRFGLLDLTGPWGWNIDSETILQLRQKLCEFETMTWAEIEGRQHHHLSAGSLTKKAIKRLEEIQQDDASDLLFSLRCSGIQRLIGIKTGREFRVLWWDPFHQVCESKLKNT